MTEQCPNCGFVSPDPTAAVEKIKREAKAEAFEEAARICKEKATEAVNHYRDVGRNGMIVLAANNAGLALSEKAAALRAGKDGGA